MSTIATYEGRYRTRLQHILGRKKWADLTQRDLDGIAGGLWRDAACFATMWKLAPKIGAMMPAARWNPPKRPTSQRLLFLEPDEARRTLDLLPESQRPIFLFALGTGMRIGELCGLQWRDIDFRRRLIHVERQLAPVGGLTTPKSGKSRIIPMSHAAEKALGMVPQGAGTAPVFTQHRNTFAEALRALQAPIGKQLTAHVLRHTFASWAVQACTQLDRLQKSWVTRRRRPRKSMPTFSRPTCKTAFQPLTRPSLPSEKDRKNHWQQLPTSTNLFSVTRIAQGVFEHECSFVEMEVRHTESRFSNLIEVELSGAIRLRFPPLTDPAYIGRLVRELGA